MEQTECPVCGSAADKESGNGDKYIYSCPRCGSYEMSGSLIAELKNGEHSDEMPALSGYLREKTLFKEKIPVITTYFLDNSLPRYGPLEKQGKLLRAIEQLTTYPGKEVRLDLQHDVSLAWAKNWQEFEYYLKSLRDRGFVYAPVSPPYDFVTITAAGWKHLEQKQSSFTSKTQVFVAMSFSEGLLPAYKDAIAPAINSTGYRPYRVDSKPHLDRIDAKIIREIKDSRFVVADVTEQKQGVYYEAGFAHGLGIPVIWCVRKDDKDSLHFDTRQYNHIIWENTNELKEKLEDTILAVIGRKPD